MKKLFGGIKLTWPKVVGFAVLMGVWTALMALIAPDGSSFHDIAVTPEWWVLPAVLIMMNCEKPLEAALKTFVFFLISQPLVYLIQVPFSEQGWGLFQYYPYWFGMTVATFPAAFVGWFVKKDKWYSGVILAGATTLLAALGIDQARNFASNPPDHLLTTIYCFATIPVFIFAILKDKIPRIIAVVITVTGALLYFFISYAAAPYEVYRSDIAEEYGIVFVGEPYLSSFITENNEGDALLTADTNEDGEVSYGLKLSGVGTAEYYFSVADDEDSYGFVYYYDADSESVVVERR